MPALRLVPSSPPLVLRTFAARARFARVALLAPVVLLACTGADHGRTPRARAATAVAAARVADDFGDTIAVAAAPARIVSLNPTTTEILFAIGAGRRLVGRTRYDRWPDSARLVPDLGPGIRPSVEAILGARPALVVLYASADNRAADARLRAAGIPTAALRIDRVADFGRATRLLGRLVGDSARATAVVDSVDRSIDAVRAATRELPRRTVFVHVWSSPLITIGGGSYLTELIDAAGGRNVYGALPAPSPAVTLEDVVRRDPDVILTGPTEASRLRRDPAWQGLRAVRDGRVLAFDTNLVGRTSVQMGMATRSLARLLHPEAFR